MRLPTFLGATGAVAMMVALGAGCSGKKEPAPGELMVSIQTDMELSKDFDTIYVEISAYGSVLHGMPYKVGPNGEIRIPATIGIVAGKDPATPVRVVITARKDTHVRVLREVTTTVPADRIALLRIPLQWLCDGQVTQQNGQTYSSCPQEQTCIAGECKSVKVDSTTLPTYTPQDVFGGASGPDMEGLCLDTVECFSHGYQAPFQADCSIDKPAGGTGVNVALFGPPGGDGICGPQACLIPLDSDPDYGWTEVGGRIKLPAAACKKVTDGKMTGIAVTTACATKTPSIPTCGPWSSVEHSSNFDAGGPDVSQPGDGEAGAEAAPEAAKEAAEDTSHSPDEEVVDAGPPQTVYDLTKNFSVSHNPFGPWNAGWVTLDADGAPMFHNFTNIDLSNTLAPIWYDPMNFSLGFPKFGINKTGATLGTGIQDGSMFFYPGPGEQTWVTWTSPGSGKAHVHVDFLLGDSAGTVKVSLLVNGVSSYEFVLDSTNTIGTYDSPLPIDTIAGTQIAFVVDPNGDFNGDLTGLRADVTYQGTGTAQTKSMFASCDPSMMGCGMQSMDSCCTPIELLVGGTYFRNNDSKFPATVKPYTLDTYEVTVGRFRRFLAEYPASIPAAGEGKNPLVAGDPGWDTKWNAAMPATALALSNALNCDTFPTWSLSQTSGENMPINCVTWYEAAAFCIWDGGYLPTEVEWNYAAAGGDDQRYFPWSQPPADTTITPGLNAVYSGSPMWPGSAMSGYGRWSHADMAGNVGEWVLDWFSASPPVPCDHCANLTGGTTRVIHDSGWNTASGEEAKLTTFARRGVDPATREMGTGFRCARGCVEGLKQCSEVTQQPQMCIGGVWVDQAPCSDGEFCSPGNGECTAGLP